MGAPRDTINGKVPAKSNCYKVIRIAGHGSLGKTAKLKAYEKIFAIQCRYYRNKNISVPFKLDMDVYFEATASDLDNSLKIVLDCLQTAHAIKNDNLCFELAIRKHVDKQRPRIDFSIEII